MDLGAAPLKVFFVITLPMIMPAVISGWLLAFTLSLDDLVIASFVSGPGATTLPMLVFSSVRGGSTRRSTPGDAHPRRGRYCWFYRLVFDGPRRKAASARYPACKTRLNHLKSVQQPPVGATLWRRFRKTLRWDCLRKLAHRMPALTSCAGEVAALLYILIRGLDLLMIP